MSSSAQEPTLLGLCDGDLDSRRHRSSFLTNKVGGQPDWGPAAPRQPPRCGRCGAAAAHVVQVYCPLRDSPYHRNLHVFACPAPGCSGRPDGWTVLRSQSLEAPRGQGAPSPAQGAPVPATGWCEAADDWGDEGEEEAGGWGGGSQEEAAADVPAATATEVDVSSRLQDLSLGGAQDAAAVFRPSFISVVDEADLAGEDGELEHARELLRAYESREGAAAGELGGGGEEDGGGGGEKYEKSKAQHGDAVFSRFMKRISLCPGQILRYQRGGEPLLVSRPPLPDLGRAVPACGACGGPRTFELQLMPALVSLLHASGGGGVELEFGTVLVYTCSDSCWSNAAHSPVTEFCFVQTDPDQELFK